MSAAASKEKRPWEIKDLFDRRAFLRAVPIFVLEKWEREGGAPGADCLTIDEIQRELLDRGLLQQRRGPKGATNLVTGFVQRQNNRNLEPSFVELLDVGIWRFNVREYETLLREFRAQYPIMGGGVPSPAQREKRDFADERPGDERGALRDRILQAVEEYETITQKALQVTEGKAKALEQENKQLHQALQEKGSALSEITDVVLRERIEPLLQSPMDTMIREAGVVLEDRLRSVGEAGSDLDGVKLVDALLNPKTPKLVFSSHPGEQDGVRMLFRGAMQFIRNPPMHKLIEYPQSTARLLIRLIDSLLQLLSEVKPRERD